MSRAIVLGREPRRRVAGLQLLDKRRMQCRRESHAGALGIVIADTKLMVENRRAGQRQSIAIGRAASFEPKVLIMDEPTAALAVAEVEAVLELIRTVSARGVSVILITHRLQDLFLVCDRIQVMYEAATSPSGASRTPTSKRSSTSSSVASSRPFGPRAGSGPRPAGSPAMTSSGTIAKARRQLTRRQRRV